MFEEIYLLKGEVFRGIGRAADMLTLSFGEKIPWENYWGKIEDSYRFGLHFQCPWRFISGQGEILLGSYDFYDPEFFQAADEPYDPDDWMDYDYFDRLAGNIEKMLPSKVDEINLNSFGDIHMTFENGISFEMLINHTRKVESWRFMDLLSEKHVVYFEEDDC